MADRELPERRCIRSKAENNLRKVNKVNRKIFDLNRSCHQKDDCRNFKVMTCDINNTHEDNWKEFIPYNEDICIEDIIPLSNYLIVEYKQDGNNFIKVVPDRYLRTQAMLC